MGSGFAKKKKEARLFQQKFQQMQGQLQAEEVTGTAGSGLVTVILNGEYVVKSVKIKPECVDPEDVEALEDLVRAAYNDASQKLEQSSKKFSEAFPALGI